MTGGNYGWPLYEGPAGDALRIAPFHSYPSADGCALTAGTFYSPVTAQFPGEYEGQYFFADWCRGWIRVIDPNDPAAIVPFAEGLAFPMDLEVGPDGTLYYIQWHDSAVYSIRYGERTVRMPTAVTLTASPAVGSAGTATTFTAVVSVVGSSSGQPDGAVDFYDGGQKLNAAPVALAGGRAEFTTSALAKGQHRITAVYGGSAAYLPASSPPLSLLVRP